MFSLLKYGFFSNDPELPITIIFLVSYLLSLPFSRDLLMKWRSNTENGRSLINFLLCVSCRLTATARKTLVYDHSGCILPAVSSFLICAGMVETDLSLIPAQDIVYVLSLYSCSLTCVRLSGRPRTKI